MYEARIRTIISDAELEQKVGKIVTDDDYNLLVTGPARIVKPNGDVLAVYLPGAVREHKAEAEPVLRALRNQAPLSDNRGNASGMPRVKRNPASSRTRTLGAILPSYVIGAVDPMGQHRWCRETVWTAAHVREFKQLRPLLQSVSAHFQAQVPDRFAVQLREAQRTKPEWVIPGTPFTTLTINLTYPTGVHTDKGDLETGFSTIAVFRNGNYNGGRLVFPRFRVAVDMHDGDLILMDAHEHHGNTHIVDKDADAERISVVAYFRTKMVRCGTRAEERVRAEQWSERRSGLV